MAVVVAGLFDEQSAATNAMDVLLRQNIEGLDTHVIEGQGRWAGQEGQGGMVVPLVPNTGNNMGTGGITNAGSGAGGGVFVPPTGGDWLNDMDEVERAFYHEGMREGATLAMARVDEDHVEHVRQIFRQHGARTYVAD